MVGKFGFFSKSLKSMPNKPHLFLLVLLSLTFSYFVIFNKSAHAAAGSSCGFNAIGDWVCGDVTGETPGGGWGAGSPGFNPFTPGGLGAFLGGGNIPSGLNGALTALGPLLAGLDPVMQACLMNHIGGLNLQNTSAADIANIASAALSTQVAINSMPTEINCPTGTVLNGSRAYQQQALISQFCNLNPAAIASGGSSFLTTLLSGFTSSFDSSFCEAAGGSGTPTSPYNDPNSDGYAGEEPPACMADGVNNWTQARSDEAFTIADRVRAGNGGSTGYCAEGVRNILSAFPDLHSGGGLGNAYEYPANLEAIGYSRLPGNYTAQTAPVGCILVFDRNNPPGASGGAAYGHVEIVATRPNGARVYVSDYVSANPGGSRPPDPHFSGCWIRHNAPPGTEECAPGGSAAGGAIAGGGGVAAGAGPSGSISGLSEVVDGSCEPVNEATLINDISRLLTLREGDGTTAGVERGCRYTDSVGEPTIGIGHLITDAEESRYPPGTCLSENEMLELFAADVNRYLPAARSQMAQLGVNSHEFLVVLTSVNFQLGTGWTSDHRDTWALMRRGEYSAAAVEAADSTWNSQTPTRVQDYQTALNNLDACT